LVKRFKNINISVFIPKNIKDKARYKENDMFKKALILIVFTIFLATLSFAENPKVIRLAITDPTPNNSHGTFLPDYFKAGMLMIEIEFNKDMDTNVKLSEKDRVILSFSGGYKLPVTKGEYITSSYWVGAVDEDTIISNYAHNGKIYVTVDGAVDTDGKKISSERSAVYYLDISPRFSTPKVFPNPISPHDYIVSVDSSEELQAPPQLLINGKVVEMKAISALSFIGSIHLDLDSVKITQIRISGTDLQGNVGHWPESYNDFSSSPRRTR
jgi:hypothetical protein